MLVIPQSWAKISLESIKADRLVNVGTPPKVKLYQNDFTPTIFTVLADLTEATFSGYADKDPQPWGAAFLNDDAKAEIDSSLVTFTHSGGATANLIYGYYVVDDAGALAWAERFPQPKLMSSTDSVISLVLRLTDSSEVAG